MSLDSNGKQNANKNNYLILAGTMLISFSSLMLEILITRIFSTVIWYHYAFIAISVAMLGLGFGGILAHFLGKRRSLLSISTIATLVFSISIPIVLYIVLWFPISMYALYVFYSISVIPFFFCGVCISSVFQSQGRTAYALYFADMFGASIGCFMVEPVLGLVSAETAVLTTAVFVAGGGILFAFASRKRKLLAASLVVLTLSSFMLVAGYQNAWVRSEPNLSKSLYRELQNPSLRDVYTNWNSFSRVDVVQGYPSTSPVAASIFIDVDAGTAIYRFNGTLNNATFLKDTIYYTPYNILGKPSKALVIGSGGGGDVLTALEGGAQHVTAVEINPIVVKVVRDLGDLDGNIYDRNDVDVVIGDGRNFVSRTNEKFDSIVLTMVDSWAALASGGYTLAENYLYTKEAFQEYYDHLTNEGVLSITRFTKEVPKLVATGVDLLESNGVPPQDVGKYIAVTSWEYEPGRTVALFMLKKTPFSQPQAETINNATLTMGQNHGVIHIPYVNTEEYYARLLTGTETLEEYCNNSTWLIRPATDDNPFFFDAEKGIPSSLSPLLLFSLSAATAVSVIPLMKSTKGEKTKPSNTRKFVLYFAALGIGYMLVEVTLVQKFVLFLGFPTRALDVILFTLLLSTGIGSLASKFLNTGNRPKSVILACLSIVSISIVYYFALNTLLAYLLPLDGTVRSVVAAVLIFPLGFFMGIPFPTAISLLASDESHVSIPSMWAVNGAMSVLGSVMATAVGITVGLSSALLAALLCYFIALLVMVKLKIKTKPS